MKHTVVRRAATTTIAALFLAAGAAVAVAPAHADADGDNAFIAYLDKKAFPYENRTAGHSARQAVLPRPDAPRQPGLGRHLQPRAQAGVEPVGGPDVYRGRDPGVLPPALGVTGRRD